MSAGTAPSTSTKRSTLKKRLSSHTPKSPTFAKSIGPAMLTKFRTAISGCVATKQAESGAPMQYPSTVSSLAPDDSSVFDAIRGRILVTQSSSVSPLSSGPNTPQSSR